MTDQSPSSRRDREREQRRQEILQAALRLFASQGYDLTTLDQIAAAAEYGKGTLYNYFSSKEELFSAMIKDGIARFHSLIGARLKKAKGTLERLDAFIDASFEFYAGNEDFLKVYMLQMVYSGAFQGPLKEQLKGTWTKNLSLPVGIFRKGIKEGIFRGNDPVRMATALKWMINSQYYMLLTARRPDIPGSAEFIRQVWRTGILTGKRS